VWATTVAAYTVRYNANGGSGTMTADDVDVGNGYTIKANTFTHSGYTFSGWNTAANGLGTDYAAGDILSADLYPRILRCMPSGNPPAEAVHQRAAVRQNRTASAP